MKIKAKKNLSVVFLVFVLGTLLSMGSFLVARNAALDRFELTFRQVADDRVVAVLSEMDLRRRELESLRRFREHSTDVTQNEFSSYTQQILDDTCVHALEWIPLIRQEQRADFEAETGIQIKEVGTGGQLVPAGERPEYFPIALAEPFKRNEAAIGFDLASNPTRWAALETARDRGKPCTTELIRLVECPTNPAVLMVVDPAYAQSSDTLDSRRKNLSGFMLGLCRVDQLVEHALGALKVQGLALLLEDSEASPENRVLHRHDPRIGTFDWSRLADARWKHEKTITPLGRRWKITLWPSDAFLQTHLYHSYWIIFPFGVLMTLLVSVLLRMQVMGRMHAEQLVEERTVALRESENRFRSLFEQSSHAQLIMQNGRFVECNQATLDMLGTTKAEFLNSHPAEWSPALQPDGRGSMGKAEEMMARALKEGRHHFEWQHVRANGQEFPLEVSLTSISTADGVRTIHAVWSDITNRKQAEGRSFLLTQVMIILNKHTAGELSDDIHHILERIYECTGFDGVGIRLREGDDFPYYATRGFPEDFVQDERFLCIRDESGNIVRDACGQPKLRCVCGSVLRGRGDPKLPFVTKNGSFWVNSTSAMCAAKKDQGYTCDGCHDAGYESLALIPLRAGDNMVGLLQLNARQSGQFTQAMIEFFEGLGSSIGIALERRQTESKLMRLSTAISHAAEAVVVTDANGLIEYVNPAFEKVTGYSQVEAIGQNPRILKSGKHDADFYVAFWKTITSGMTWEGRFINKRKDGTIYTEDASVSPVRDDHGTIVNYVAVKRDVTHELVREERYRQAQKMETVGRLAGGIAHDFNNILQTISGFCEILILDMDGCMAGDPTNCASHKADVLQISKAAQHAAELTRQLLTFSRKQPAEHQKIDLNSVLKENHRILQQVLDERITLEFNLPAESIEVFADASQIIQIVMNLLINARDAIREYGVVRIAVENIRIDEHSVRDIAHSRLGDFVCLTVSDTGTGMPEEVLGHLFEPFYTNKKVGEGTGLGLAVVYGIIQNHRGWINVSSTLGEGTTFRIYLPTSMESGVAPAAAAAEREAGTRILLVEDDPVVRNLTGELLQGIGYVVASVETAQAAEELFALQQEEFDLLFIDVMLPDRNGIDLAETLLKMNAGLPVLMFSGHSDEQVDLARIANNGFFYLRKPFSLKKLLDAVVQSLGSRPGS